MMSQDYDALIKELERLERISEELVEAPATSSPVEAKPFAPRALAVLQRFFSQRNWQEVESFNEVLEEIHNRLSIQGDDTSEVVEDVMQLLDDLLDTAETCGYAA